MENTPFSPDNIFKRIQSLSIELFSTLPLKTLRPSRKLLLIGWKPPPFGFYKLNRNGSAKSNPSVAGAGGLIKDHKGNWIGFSRNIGFTHSLIAKLWGLRDGLNLGKNLNIKKLHVELDAKVVTDIITTQNESSFSTHLCNPLIFDCRLLIQTFEEVLVCQTYSEGNHYADLLAKEGCSITDSFLLYSHPSPPVLYQLLVDAWGVAYPRLCNF